MTNKLMPGKPVPSLDVETLEGVKWQLEKQDPRNFSMIVFYRGYHCPASKPYLQEIDRRLGKFLVLGIEVIAISSDDRAKAELAQDEWGIENMMIGYGAGIDKMREWGLYISKAAFEGEPDIFNEFGLFMVRADHTLYFAEVSSAPYGHPNVSDTLYALDLAINQGHPMRGGA
ncbi:alkyl hydroperoxide reductase/ Thiol specific antioxidant/ Mal allergen [Thalassoporum mexicanum PCC 7367]|uniref:redoxin domain-containing protein n=1 Tax=Thalassoporum mexicanum TaxID=3457544 RepID=UPI00029FF840|nr:redoxin domain-containing protein [Pseudanabaena sp. PCC 7367]AFY70643.1 alkyl hydroperoxide reductase/ Thiol specific antioxidant/ Mal allergen [Pseudanabaena sp. PCC 7367]